MNSVEVLEVQEQEAVSLLKQYKPFGEKLVRAGYAYVFDPVDLTYIPVHEQIKTYLLEHESKGEAIFKQSGTTTEESRWLIAFYVIRDVLWQRIEQKDSEPFQPFQDRLTSLENEWQDIMAEGSVSLWMDLDLHVLVDLARSNPLYLFAVEKRLARMRAERVGDPLPDYTVLEMTLLSSFAQQARTDGLLSLIPADTRTPSQVTETAWLLALRKPGHFPDYEKAGKWMCFPTRAEVDLLWQRVAAATKEGRLGPLSKVSTARPKKRPQKHEYVIQIYTDDQTNQRDISRVCNALRALGVILSLSYGRVRR